MRLYTIHQKGRRAGMDDIRTVSDRFNWLAFLLWPVWLIWNGLWTMALLIFLLMVTIALVAPHAALPVSWGLAFIFALEGGAFCRAELRLRGWQEVGVVEARSAAGAEELFLAGRSEHSVPIGNS